MSVLNYLALRKNAKQNLNLKLPAYLVTRNNDINNEFE